MKLWFVALICALVSLPVYALARASQARSRTTVSSGNAHNKTKLNCPDTPL